MVRAYGAPDTREPQTSALRETDEEEAVRLELGPDHFHGPQSRPSAPPLRPRKPPRPLSRLASAALSLAHDGCKRSDRRSRAEPSFVVSQFSLRRQAGAAFPNCLAAFLSCGKGQLR